jgi:hypothetical protein
MPTFLTGQELSERLDIPYGAVMAKYRAGLIPGIRISGAGYGRVMFNLEKVIKAIREAANLELEPVSG